MKTAEYIAPAIEVIEMEVNEAIMGVSQNAIADPTISDGSSPHSGKNFWGD